MNKHIVAILLLAAVAIGIAMKLYSNKKILNEKKNPPSSTLLINVTAEPVLKKPASGQLKKSGVLKAFKEVDISSTAAGKIEAIDFEPGMRVKEGQIIAHIDCRMQELQLQQAELALSKLEKDYQRFQTLLEGDATTPMTVEELQLNYEKTRTQAEQLRKQIHDCKIKAPVSGIVIRRNFDEGEYVNYGTPLGTIVDIEKLKMQVMVTENEVYRLTVNQEATITPDIFPDQHLRGKISFISASADPTQSFLVEIVLHNNPDKPLRGGTFAYVTFSDQDTAWVLQIPRKALAESIKNPYVYVVENNRALKRTVKVGREFGNYLEVLDGLQENEWVVTSGQINLNDQTPVNIVAEN
ncbi:MAG: MexH family multidrug efflux RND transporter periplasmic adaptor subunit [Chitinophagales bacterium]|nr:MAG: MexH family multidrug efflux RND transporter periplasmic adaptor subunit [Chitinophagales bacterium]